ncbi:hypothetical protein AGMMS49579_13570 [Spirochaetia bacterium]|nr:hypothetical protein AGMMS49579_13570 [Spirochaetia bacterium]
MASLEYEVVINRIVRVLQEYGSLLKRLKYFPQSIEKRALLGNDSRYQDAIMDENHLNEMLRKLNDDGLLEMYNNCRDLARIYGLTVGKFLTRADNITKSSGIKENNQTKYTDPRGLSASDKQVGWDIVCIYDRKADTLQIIKVANNSSHTASTLAVYDAGGHVRNRTEPVMGTMPGGASGGEASQFYFPIELPNGHYGLGKSRRYEEGTEKYNKFGPAFVPINTTQDVPVYGTTEPSINPETGQFEPTGTQSDIGYGVHYARGTTWGCVGVRSLEGTIKFADLVDSAIDNGGKATLDIW